MVRAYTLTHPDIVQHLCQAKDRGVDVRVIYDAKQYHAATGMGEAIDVKGNITIAQIHVPPLGHVPANDPSGVPNASHTHQQFPLLRRAVEPFGSVGQIIDTLHVDGNVD